jgi:hypothetical protein
MKYAFLLKPAVSAKTTALQRARADYVPVYALGVSIIESYVDPTKAHKGFYSLEMSFASYSECVRRVSLDVFTAEIMKNAVFWDIKSPLQSQVG